MVAQNESHSGCIAEIHPSVMPDNAFEPVFFKIFHPQPLRECRGSRILYTSRVNFR